MKFYNDDVAIVAYSGVFPECDDEHLFFDRILRGDCLIRDLTKDEANSPVQLSPHLASTDDTADRSISRFGSKISVQQVLSWARKNQLDTESFTTLEIVIHELMRRLDERTPGLFASSNSECLIGVSTGEIDATRIGLRKGYERIKKDLTLSASERSRIDAFMKTFDQLPARRDWLEKDRFSTLIFDSIRERFNVGGASAFIDAACASSLAAIMLAVRRVREGDRDLVITGGVDLGSVLLTLFAFSQLRVVSSEIMNPFDRSASGMNQGEGAGIFALMRLADAKAKGFPIFGVIRNCDGSSDGSLGGMVEPTAYGQNLAYERAYQEVPLYPVSYLECHGTGTKLGDHTELSSTAKFFHPLPPIGSVKSNIGHCIAAAGAMSLIKALKMIETRTIPTMPNFQKMDPSWSHVVHKTNQSFESNNTIRIGISSFGFGGANYHMVVDEYRGEDPVASERPTTTGFRFVLNGIYEMDLDFIEERFAASRFKIPPISLPYVDHTILGAMLAVDELFKLNNIRVTQKHREKIGVISTTNSYLDKLNDAYERVGHLEVYRRLDDPKRTQSLIETRMPNDLKVTEDTFMWGLNNLVSGRITKDFDLKGPNFNFASEKVSLGLALDIVRTSLKSSSGAYLIIDFDEMSSHTEFRMRRSKVRALLVSDLEFALAADLPIRMEFDQIVQQRTEIPHVNS